MNARNPLSFAAVLCVAFAVPAPAASGIDPRIKPGMDVTVQRIGPWEP